MLALTLIALAVVEPGPQATAADSVVAAAFDQNIDTSSQNLKGVASNSSLNPALVPLLGIVGLAAFVFTMRKRRQQIAGEGIRVLEATSLGDKRSLVIADVLGERMVLAVSEAGVTVLMQKPAPELEPVVISAPPPVPSPTMGFFARLTGKTPVTAFDAALQESLEDQELRAKLAAGVRGVVP
jgi:flagellar biogenesis protein FliO